MDVLLESQVRRQHILDYLHAHGPASSRQISDAVGQDYRTMRGTLVGMRDRGEVSFSGLRNHAVFIALVNTTVSADKQYNAIRDHHDRKKLAAEAAKVEKQNNEPWRTVHKGGEDPAIKSQGGQGSLRRTVYVNCSSHY